MSPSGKVAAYRAMLRTTPPADWDGLLLRESGLPGPRANLELAQAVAEEGDAARFRRYLALDVARAPAGAPAEFLALCGAVGLGRLLAAGETGAAEDLRHLAAHPRWRVREGVALALQRLGDADMDALLAVLRGWSRGTLWEQRAAVAAVCEPRLLRQPGRARAALELLDGVTAALSGAAPAERREEAFRALRQALGYGWSVAVRAAGEAGKPYLERWAGSADPDVRWVVRQNLDKARLRRMDEAWTRRWAAQLA